jgi:hypothetical protein
LKSTHVTSCNFIHREKICVCISYTAAGTELRSGSKGMKREHKKEKSRKY